MPQKLGQGFQTPYNELQLRNSANNLKYSLLPSQSNHNLQTALHFKVLGDFNTEEYLETLVLRFYRNTSFGTQNLPVKLVNILHVYLK